MCAKPVSIDVNSSLPMGVQRICPRILPPQAALENIYQAWQKNGWRCVAPRVVSCVLLQIPTEGLCSVSGGNLVESIQWRALVKPVVKLVKTVQTVVVVEMRGNKIDVRLFSVPEDNRHSIPCMHTAKLSLRFQNCVQTAVRKHSLVHAVPRRRMCQLAR